VPKPSVARPADETAYFVILAYKAFYTKYPTREYRCCHLANIYETILALIAGFARFCPKNQSNVVNSAVAEWKLSKFLPDVERWNLLKTTLRLSSALWNAISV